jgi:hypothetical protein
MWRQADHDCVLPTQKAAEIDIFITKRYKPALIGKSSWRQEYAQGAILDNLAVERFKRVWDELEALWEGVCVTEVAVIEPEVSLW